MAAPMSAATVKKLLAHPDKDEIISKLLSGFAAKDVAEWLKSKYSTPDMLISASALKAFADEQMNLYEAFDAHYKQVQSAVKKSDEQALAELSLDVKKSAKYKERLIELADNKLDTKRMIERAVLALEEHVGNIWDMIQEDPNNTLRHTKALTEAFDKFGSWIDRHAKLVEAKPDQVIQHNVSIEHIDKQADIFQEAIKEALSEFDTDVSLRFVQSLNEKLKALKYKAALSTNNEALSVEEARILTEEVHSRISS